MNKMKVCVWKTSLNKKSQYSLSQIRDTWFLYVSANWTRNYTHLSNSNHLHERARHEPTVLTGQELCSHYVEKLLLPVQTRLQTGSSWRRRYEASGSLFTTHSWISSFTGAQCRLARVWGRLSAERGLAAPEPRHGLQRCWNAPPEQMKGHQQADESAGASGAEKLNWCLSASLSPLNYSSADGAPETTALEGSQRRAGGVLWRCREFRGGREKKWEFLKNI